MAKKILKRQLELEKSHGKVKQCKKIIKLAEKFCKNQAMADSTICMAALKDIRRVLNS